MSESARSIQKTSLEPWMESRLGLRCGSLTAQALTAYQLDRIRETVTWARTQSRFYSRLFRTVDESSLATLDEVRRLPLTTPEDVKRDSSSFLCVSQSDIHRIVTLTSSGTSGEAKRLYFTADDQELTVDFFHHGVATMAAPGDRMFIALPGNSPGSVGDLLAKGIARHGVIPVPHGFCREGTMAAMEDTNATVIIGAPIELLALAREQSALADRVFNRLRSIVLCNDHVPESIVRILRQRANCEVFEHYGSTEMGLGGGIDCRAHSGYHLREADLYFEIVDVETGEPLPDGKLGEIVVTTLTRRGMPLIRYRTGDISRFVPGTCKCGTVLRRLERVRERKGTRIALGDSGEITIAMLDEVLFPLEGLLNFSASVEIGGRPILTIKVFAPTIQDALLVPAVLGALDSIAPIARGRQKGDVEVAIDVVKTPLLTSEKRQLKVIRR